MFRTGGEEYAKANDSHGVATLLREQATVQGGSTTAFRFSTTSSQVADVELTDERVARLVTSLQRSRGGSERLLRYRDDEGWHDVMGPDLDAALKEIAGEDLSPGIRAARQHAGGGPQVVRGPAAVRSP